MRALIKKIMVDKDIKGARGIMAAMKANDITIPQEQKFLELLTNIQRYKQK